jgi:hypothetical protein
VTANAVLFCLKLRTADSTLHVVVLLTCTIARFRLGVIGFHGKEYPHFEKKKKKKKKKKEKKYIYRVPCRRLQGQNAPVMRP